MGEWVIENQDFRSGIFSEKTQYESGWTREIKRNLKTRKPKHQKAIILDDLFMWF